MELTINALTNLKEAKNMEENLDFYHTAIAYPYYWNCVCTTPASACAIAYSVMCKYIKMMVLMGSIRTSAQGYSERILETQKDSKEYVKMLFLNSALSLNGANDDNDLCLISTALQLSIRLLANGKEIIITSPLFTNKFPFPVCILKLCKGCYLPVFPSFFVFIINKSLSSSDSNPSKITFYKYGHVYTQYHTIAQDRKMMYRHKEEQYYTYTLISRIQQTMSGTFEQVCNHHQRVKIVHTITPFTPYKFLSLYNNYVEVFSIKHLYSPILTALMKGNAKLDYATCKECKNKQIFYTMPPCKQCTCISCINVKSKKQSKFKCRCDKHMMNANQIALQSIFMHWLTQQEVDFSCCKVYDNAVVKHSSQKVKPKNDIIVPPCVQYNSAPLQLHSRQVIPNASQINSPSSRVICPNENITYNTNVDPLLNIAPRNIQIIYPPPIIISPYSRHIIQIADAIQNLNIQNGVPQYLSANNLKGTTNKLGGTISLDS